MIDLSPTLIALLAFGAVTAVVFVIGQVIATQARVQQRIGAPTRTAGGPAAANGFMESLDALVKTYFDEKRFGVQGSVRSNLRREMVRAAFFNPRALNYYIFARLAVAIVLPAVAYLAIQIFLGDQPWFLKLAVVAIAIMIGVLGPD